MSFAHDSVSGRGAITIPSSCHPVIHEIEVTGARTLGKVAGGSSNAHLGTARPDKKADPGDVIVAAVRAELSRHAGVITKLAKSAGMEKVTVGGVAFSLDRVGLGAQGLA